MAGFFDRFRMRQLEVTCITRRDDPSDPIDGIGGPEFYAIVEHVIAAIQFGRHAFWVSVDGNRVGIVFKRDQERKRFYLTTRDEGFPSRTLMSLPEGNEEARRRPSLQLSSPKGWT